MPLEGLSPRTKGRISTPSVTANLTHKLKISGQGLERWLSREEHLAVLAEDPGTIPSTHVTSNPTSSKESDALF